MKAVLGLTLSSVLLTLAACGGGNNEPPRIDDVLEQLQPGTTLHTVDERYRRYGPAEEIYDRHFPEYGPETLTHESWIEFDSDGKLVNMRAESRREDGSIYRRTRLDGAEVIVEDAEGVEVSRRQEGLGNAETVDLARQAYQRAVNETIAALEGHPDAPTVTLRNTEVRVIETRREFTRTLQPASASSFSAPYLYDLHPVEEIRRSYVLPDGRRGLRSEVAVVGEDGTETVVESTDHLVFEVLDG